jgi:hypothetical protein
MTKMRPLFILTIILISSWSAIAQPTGGGPGGGGPPVPISGIEILIAVGGLIGLKKIFDSRKSK